MSRTLLAALAVLLLWPGVAAGQELVVYSSMPLQGASRSQATDLVRGIDFAIEQAAGQAGGRPIRHVSLDGSTARAGTWTPQRVARNARRAAQDDATIAYIGEFNSPATAISLPILNEAGILQVSPSNTAIGLTRGGPGTMRGEPDRYYPTGERTFGRIQPNDRVQAVAAGAMLQAFGRTRVLVVHDGEVYGRGLARLAADAARARDLAVSSLRRLRRGNARALARAARRFRADAVFFGGITANHAPRLWRALARVPGLQLFAGDGVAESGFTEAIPQGAAARTHVLVSTLAPDAYPPEGRAFFDAFSQRYDDPQPDPYAIYGYEAMRIVLDSIEVAGADKAGVVRAFFGMRDRETVLGTYSIDENGDTTLSQYGVYAVEDGALRFDRVIDAAAR